MINWSKRQDVTGRCAAKRIGGNRKLLLLGERDWLLAWVSAAPALTVRALRTELAERGTDVCVDTVWRFLMAEGLTFKKNCARPSRTGLTSPASVCGGSATSATSIPSG